MRRVLFEPEHEAFRDSARIFIAKEVTPHYPEWDRAGIVPRELFALAGALGLFAAVPGQSAHNHTLLNCSAHVGSVPR